MKILVDPHVLSVPPAGSSRPQLVAFVEGLDHWVNTLATSCPFIEARYSSTCLAHMFELDTYPSSNKIRDVLKSACIYEYDAHDLSRIITRFFDTCDDVEGELWFESLSGMFSHSPAELIDRLPRPIAESYHECLVKIALQREIDASQLCDIYIGTVPSGSGSATLLTITGSITQATLKPSAPIVAQLPMVIRAEVGIVFHSEDVLRLTGWDAVWEYPEWAVRKGYYESIPVADRTIYQLQPFLIGSQFTNTIRALHVDTQPSLLRSIFETSALIISGFGVAVAGIKPRPLRGTSRTGAIARRATLTKHGPGYRLHYWECTNGVVELSCVNVHNDYDIY